MTIITLIPENLPKFFISVLSKKLIFVEYEKKIRELQQELETLDERFAIHTTNRVYLTSKVNSLFSLKRDFMGTLGVIKEKLPTKIDEESSLVAGVGLEPTAFGL